MSGTFKAPAAILDELGVTEPSEIVVESIAEYCGATVVYEPLEGSEARILGVGDRAIITVNANASSERRRFSAAHELGHWMRDRGKVAFSCTEQALVKEWDDDNPERRANRYAADLLMPRRLFKPAIRGFVPSFDSVRRLAATYGASLTATAIRLVELSDLPSMVLAIDTGGRRWFFRSEVISDGLWPRRTPGAETGAMRLLSHETPDVRGPQERDADEWIDHPEASRYTLVEDSLLVTTGVALTILWWKDEAQVLALDPSNDRDDEEGLTGVLKFGGRRSR